MKITAYLPPKIIDKFLKGESIPIESYLTRPINYAHLYAEVEFDSQVDKVKVHGNSIFVQKSNQNDETT